MVITEEELREAWRNGQGRLPDFPADARFTPAARDFLAARGLCPGRGGGTACIGREPVAGGSPAGGDVGAASGSAGAAFAAWLQGAAPSAFAGGGSGPREGAEAQEGGRMELKGEGGKRLIITAEDVDDLVRGRPETVVVHPSATLTDAARERLRNAGIRVIPFTERKPDPAEPISHNATAQPPSAADAALARERRTLAAAEAARPGLQALGGGKEELFRKAKPAIMERLGGQADEALVDAVLRRVLASL